MSTLNVQYVDYEGKPTTFSLPISSAVGLTALQIADLINDAETALDAVTLGARKQTNINLITQRESVSFAGSAFAQRENKWLITGRGLTTGKLYQRELGTADLALLLPNSENMNISAGAGQAFVTWLNATWSEILDDNITTEDVNVVEIVFVGRST
jgi:hypothetical protein